MTEKERIVIPGEQLGVIEEFLPKENCFEDKDGAVYSSNWGSVVQNKQDHSVSVKSKDTFYPKSGLIALGYVTEIRKQTASLHIASFYESSIRSFVDIKYVYYGILHITNISDQYIRATHDAVRPGDWVICRIIQPNSPLPVSMFGSQIFGIISASCFQCGMNADKYIKRNLIKCLHCGATQTRSLSKYFNNIESIQDTDLSKYTIKPREFGQDRGRDSRRHSGGRHRGGERGPRREHRGPRREHKGRRDYNQH